MPAQLNDSTLPPSFETVFNQALKYSSAPVLIAQLFSVLNKPDGTMGEIVDLIRTDATLAVETLRLANSPLYGGLQVETLEDALFRLGTREIVKLASHLVASTWMTIKIPMDEWDSRGFLRQCVCRAVAAEFICRKLNSSAPELAYTAALLQDAGRLALVTATPGFIPVIAATARLEKIYWADAEATLLGFDCITLGTALLKAWQFPEGLLMAIEFMREPGKAPESFQPILTAILAARLVADSINPHVINTGNLFAIDLAWLKQNQVTQRLLEDTMVDTISRVSEQLNTKLQPGVIEFQR
ncbi:MAG: HDOD domain-containing protein [Verrucomicrobiota bacterium]|nr:HDOD domain-containing protein [Verrucomicrobiota bacterium]